MSPGPERERALALLGQMWRIRLFEEKCAELYSAGKIRGFLHLYIGEEAVAAGVLSALRPEDGIVSTYREHGHALARGIPADKLMAELYGKATGCSHGRGGSMHLFDAASRFFGGFAIVAGGLPVAVGLGLADRLAGRRQQLTACFFGDGAMAEGEFHESMNLAALWELPVLFVCENNRYAMGTALERHQAQLDLVLKARGYAIEGEAVDGMDALAVEAVARRAAERVRATGRPFFLECQTYRYRAHSMYDAELYRSKEEVERWKRRDPIPALGRVLAQAGVPAAELDALRDRAAKEVEAAVAFAEKSPWEPEAELLNHVYAKGAQP